jgi:hypothetical protein
MFLRGLGLLTVIPSLLGDCQNSGVRFPISSQHLFPMLCPVLSIVSPTLARGLASPGWALCGGCQESAGVRQEYSGTAGGWNVIGRGTCDLSALELFFNILESLTFECYTCYIIYSP